MFVYFWDTLAGLMRTLLSLLPLVVGVGTGLYVLLKKKTGVFAREGAAVLWIAGVTTSFALFNGLFYLDIGFRNLLLADVLLLLPVMFLLDSVFAFTAETVLSLLLLANMPYGSAGWWIAVATAAFLVCCGYLPKNRQSTPVKTYCAWTSLLGVCVYAVILAMYLARSDGWLILTIPYLFFLALCIANEAKPFSLRLRLPALIVLSAATFGLCVYAQFNSGSLPAAEKGDLIAEAVCGALFLAAGIFLGRRSFRNDPLRIAFIALFAAFAVLLCLWGDFPPMWVAVGFSAALGVLTVIAGVKIGRLLAANVGMLMLTITFYLVLIQIASVDLLSLGAALLVTGLIFLFVNRRMIKKFRLKEKQPEEEGVR